MTSKGVMNQQPLNKKLKTCVSNQSSEMHERSKSADIGKAAGCPSIHKHLGESYTSNAWASVNSQTQKRPAAKASTKLGKREL